MKKHGIIAILLFFSVCVFAQKTEVISEAVSPAKPVHLIGSTENIDAFIKMYVENGVAAWQMKDEFEKTSDYKLRVTTETRLQKAEQLKNEAFQIFKDAYIVQLDVNDYVLGEYDADNETFLVESRTLGDFVVSVPINEAKSFKSNFYSCKYSGFDFYAKDNKMHLAKVRVTDPETNKSYTYDSKEGVVYVTANITYNFDPIEVDGTTGLVTENQGAKISTETVTVGSDPVDINIPETNSTLDNTFALVIGNENYENEIDVPYAKNDARIFSKYLNKTLGIPSKRIAMVENATLGNILGEIGKLKTVAETYNGEAKLIVYYAGHGMPDNNSKEAYLLPVDGNSGNMSTAYSLEKMYSELTAFPTEQVTVFLDACFSGSARNGDKEMLASGRGLAIEPNTEVLQGNLVVFSAATGKQTAHPYTERGHGLFTYYLLLKMQESSGNVNFKDLSEYLKTKVSRTALDIDKEQTPDVNYSPGIGDNWQNMRLK